MSDKWDRITGYCCATCQNFSPKGDGVGRCRRHAPTMAGYPVVYEADDWCGDHKIGTNPTKEVDRGERLTRNEEFNAALGGHPERALTPEEQRTLRAGQAQEGQGAGD